MNENSGTFYAVAFAEFYADDEVIALPSLSTNTVEELDGNEYSKWSAPDWKWNDIPYEDADLRESRRVIEKAAGAGDDVHWASVYSRYVEAFVRVAKKLTAELRKHPQAGKDFGAFVFNEESDDEIEVLQRCMTPAKFKKLFPHLDAEVQSASKLASSSLDDQLTTYRGDIRRYEEQILALGDVAIPFLIDVLNDERQAWAAADFIGRLGIPDPRAINALRLRAKSGHGSSFHETGALALLGDVDFVLELARSPKTAEPAVQGISFLTSCIASDCLRVVPLNYRPIESLLDDPATTKLASRHLSDAAHFRMAVTDVDEALRGLESRHTAMRLHAVSHLGERRLGKAAGERILPALARALQDADPDVRRVAIVSLSYWKKAARPWAAQVRELFSDPVGRVAKYARQFLPDIES